MQATRIERHGSVFVVRLLRGKNLFDPQLLDELNGALDEIEATQPSALVTVGDGKFFSTGFDFAALTDPVSGPQLIRDAISWLERVLRSPVPCVAAVNGHAFGMGFVAALAHEFRIMRADRGYLCLPEIDLRLPFPPAMLALIKARLSLSSQRDMLLTGCRLGGTQARERGIVDAALPEHEVLPAAIHRAEEIAQKCRATYGRLKLHLNASLLDELVAAKDYRFPSEEITNIVQTNE